MTLTILGCHSATPRTHRNPTSQVLEVKGHLFLIDCGEGTQVMLRRNKIKFSRIKHIFISHLHGDHYFGLIGLISTFQLLGRSADLYIYAPKGLKEVILLQLKLANSWTKFNLIFRELTATIPEIVFEDEGVEVSTIPLDHRVYTNGFLFKEKPGDRILRYDEAIKKKVDVAYFRKLKQGYDVHNKEGVLIKNNEVTDNPKPIRSYAYCSDTLYYPQIVPFLKGVDLMYHESTFLEEHRHMAQPTGHSTAKQAASIAKEAGVKTLLLGHFSTRYDQLESFRLEAQEIFDRVLLAEDGKSINFEELERLPNG